MDLQCISNVLQLGERDLPMKTNIYKVGNSNAVRIPKTIMKSLGLNTNDEIKLTVVKDQIVIKKIRKKKNIKELFANYDKKIELKEEFDDPLVGREVL